MKMRPAIIIIAICILVAAIGFTAYILGQRGVDEVFDGELDAAALQRLTENQETFLVYFYGRTCKDCIAIEPYFIQALEQAREDGLWRKDIAVYKCERNENATVRSLYGVESTPSFIYFYEGQKFTINDDLWEDTQLYYDYLADLMESQTKWEEHDNAGYDPATLIL